MSFFDRKIVYVQVFQDHFIARVVGGDRTIWRQCHALANSAGPVSDWGKVRACLRDLFSELVPGFSLLRPWALLHFIPGFYDATTEELREFKQTAERSGVGVCFLSRWETPHTDQELVPLFQ